MVVGVGSLRAALTWCARGTVCCRCSVQGVGVRGAFGLVCLGVLLVLLARVPPYSSFFSFLVFGSLPPLPPAAMTAAAGRAEVASGSITLFFLPCSMRMLFLPGQLRPRVHKRRGHVKWPSAAKQPSA